MSAADLALKSVGSAAPNKGWTLDRNGYVGTYVRVNAPGKMDVSIDSDDAARLTVVVADAKSKGASHSFDLPKGTWFVRVELSNDGKKSTGSATIRSIEIRGATVVNEHSDANALAAAKSYIENFRKGAATLKLAGVSPGDEVRVKLKRHAFMFGTAVAGFETGELLNESPPDDSNAAHYQQAILRNFNAVVPGNAGKWAYNEKDRDAVTMDYIDTLRRFARDNKLHMRMHALMWDTGQQPQWVQDLLKSAAAGDADAKKQLREEISERVQYYVRDRAASYDELDVLNEVHHQPRYLQVFGIEGLAEIYAEAGRAVADAGANSRLYINEFNVFQWSKNPPFGDNDPWDPYASWLREHAEALRDAGGTVGGIGIQYYVNPDPKLPQPHSSSRIFGALQNLAVGGLPVTLTEFGATTGADETLTTKALEDTVRLVFGTSSATGFIMWGFWESELWEQAMGAAFYAKDWKPRLPAKRWEALMREWDTDLALKADTAGAVQFSGFYGDYDVTVNGKTMTFTLSKGKADYSLAGNRIFGRNLALRSSGAATGSAWTLSSNGYVGTYIYLDQLGDVTITLDASGIGNVRPHVNIVVDDSKARFDIDRESKPYEHRASGITI